MTPTTLPPKMTEKQFRQMIYDAARLLSYRVYFTWTSIHSPAGFPDLVLCKPRSTGDGRVIFAELKTDKGKVTPAQQAWIDDLAAAGMEAVVWRPADIDAILATLAQED